MELDYRPPWIGYVAVAENVCVGVCGFKHPPAKDEGVLRVEIAYCTLPEHEGLGFATAMASELIRLTNQADPTVIVAAQTLREEGASTTILRKLGFELWNEEIHPEDGEVWEWRIP
ncbi:hypothetical protein Pla175_27860 [Pirellulimonas nuda]|uniref:N-acetyltransferase domain-containing protein n=2 Tax=Pirellulimonas nuda TaxID=2528009 RepID=A0A518DD84_9BACT|nr:hypothetical protein Pla175_27860 [Pirellulimonas nuda]